MQKRKLVALKGHRYGTRRLEAGEEYEAPDRQAIALVASRRARYAEPDKPKITESPKPAPQETEEEIEEKKMPPWL